MLVSGRVVDLKRNSLGGFAPWVSEDDEPWTPFSPAKWLAQGTGDDAGNLLFRTFSDIKKGLGISFEGQGTSPSKRPLSSSSFKISCKSPIERIRDPKGELVIWGDALEFWILLCKWLLGSILIESQTLRAQKNNVCIYIYIHILYGYLAYHQGSKAWYLTYPFLFKWRIMTKDSSLQPSTTNRLQNSPPSSVAWGSCGASAFNIQHRSPMVTHPVSGFKERRNASGLFYTFLHNVYDVTSREDSGSTWGIAKVTPVAWEFWYELKWIISMLPAYPMKQFK